MKLAALISGGKDSAFALYKTLQAGHNVTYLVTIRSENPHSYMYHTANIHLTELFAEAVDIPLITETTSGKKESELKDLERALRRIKVDGVVAGSIESEYQASRVGRVCESLGLEMYTPLWHMDPEMLLREMVEVMDIRIVHVAAHGLDEGWLGRKIDLSTIEELKRLKERYGIHIAGEGGEYETLVVDATFFAKSIELVKTERIWHGDYGALRILKAVLVEG